MHTCYLALGSNQGNRLAHLRDAVAALQKAGYVLTDASSVYETSPVGCNGLQGDFLNAVIALETDHAPADLLRQCLAIEAALGRVRTGKNSVRTIDIDLLLANGIITADTDAAVPHPRLHERLFVLTPLREIAAGVVHPVIGKTIGELYDACSKCSGEVVRLFAPAARLGMPAHPRQRAQGADTPTVNVE